MNYGMRNKGFTIVELIVAMTVFIILLGIIVNIFVASLKTQRSLVALRLTNDNAGLALEQMAREIRVGEDFKVGGSARAGQGVELRFTSPRGRIVYKFNDTDKAIERSSKDGQRGSFSPITGKNVEIKKLNFFLVKNLPSWPPRITITLEVASKNVELKDFVTDIQTTVSGRNL